MVAGLAAGMSSSSLWTDSYISECRSSFRIQFLVFHSSGSSTKFFTGSKINQTNLRQKKPWDVPVKAQVTAILQCTGCCEDVLQGCHGMFSCPCNFLYTGLYIGLCGPLIWLIVAAHTLHSHQETFQVGINGREPRKSSFFSLLVFKDGFSKMDECGKDIKRVIFYGCNKTGHH